MSGAACCRAQAYVDIAESLEVRQFILLLITDIKVDAELFSSTGLWMAVSMAIFGAMQVNTNPTNNPGPLHDRKSHSKGLHPRPKPTTKLPH